MLFEQAQRSIESAWEMLIHNQESDGSWGHVEKPSSYIWNTSFIMCSLLEVHNYDDIKDETQKAVDYIVNIVSNFLDGEPNNTTSLPNVALAHSLSVFMKIGHEELAKKISKYLLNVQNINGGWGWDKFSSSDIYSTPIIVKELIEAVDIFCNNNEKNEMKNQLCKGIKWIIENQNRDGGWGIRRGSDPKHTAIILLTLQRAKDKLPLNTIGNLLLNQNMDEIIKRGFQWLCSPEAKIPGKGWRVDDRDYIHRVGFEATAYTIWTLMNYEKVDNNFTEGLQWLSTSQRHKGYWPEYEDTEHNKFGGEYHNFNLALGIFVLSKCMQEIAKSDTNVREFADKLLDVNAVLRAKLSALTSSKLLIISKKPLIILSYPAGFIILILIGALLCLYKDFIVSILLGTTISVIISAVTLGGICIGVIKWLLNKRKRG